MNSDSARQLLQDELSKKRICRFCLTKNNQRLEHIFLGKNSFGSQNSNLSSSQSINSTLPIHIMAIASIEVLPEDGMPPYICQDCFSCFEYSYQFKQMCKKAEHLLRQVPLTGIWPNELQRPRLIKTETNMTLRSLSSSNNDDNKTDKKLYVATYGNSRPDSSSGCSSESVLDINNKPKPSVVIINGRNSMNWSNNQRLSEEKKKECKPLSQSRNDIDDKSDGNAAGTVRETRIIIKQKLQNQQVMTNCIAPKKILNTSSAAIHQKGKNTIEMDNNIVNNRNENSLNKEHISDVDEATQSFLRKIENDDELLLDDVQRLIESDSGQNGESINITIDTETSVPSTSMDTTTSSVTESVSILPTTTTSPLSSSLKPKQNKTSVVNLNRPKLLNKSSVRILNKEAIQDLEPRLSVPKIKQNNNGNVEIVAEILDVGEPYEHEPDPRDAKPIEVNVYPCPLCERSFPLQQLRDLHVEKHKRKRDHKCEICSKCFYTKYDLQKHVVTHSYDKPYKCTACNKSFARSNLLFRHEKTHTEIPKYICVHCEKPFLTPETLDKHVERHNKRRPYQCKLCNKAFAFKQGLERHEILHSREQPHSCQYCEMSFSTTSKLARHLTAHAGERPFPCKICSKSYLLSHHFTRHLRSHKNMAEVGSVLFQCTQCNKQFPTQKELVQHSSDIHVQDSLFCPICNEKSSNVTDLKDHINLHSCGEIFACEFCDFMFMSADKLNAHTIADHAADVKVYNDDEAKQKAAQKTTNEIAVQSSTNNGDKKSDEVNKEVVIMDDENITQYLNSLDSEVEKLFQDTVENFYIEESTGELKAESLSQLQNELNVSDDQPEIIDQIIKKPVTSNTKTVDNTWRKQEIKSVLKIDNDENVQDRSDSGDEALPVKRKRVDRSSASSSKLESTLSSSLLSVLTSQNKPMSDKTLSTSKTDSAQILKGLPQSITVRKTIKPTQNISTTSTTGTGSCSKGSAPVIKEQISVQNSETKIKKLVNVDQEAACVDNFHEKMENKIKSAIINSDESDVVKMQIGDKKVKLHKILVTKSEAAALAKDGRIQYEGGNMILRGNRLSSKRAAMKKSND